MKSVHANTHPRLKKTSVRHVLMQYNKFRVVNLKDVPANLKFPNDVVEWCGLVVIFVAVVFIAYVSGYLLLD